MTLVSLVVQTINKKVCDMSAITIAKDINMLLEAAAYVDNPERERKSSLSDLSDHYYALNSSLSEKKTKSNKQIGQRLSHNQSEKVRRAHLRSALDELKDLLPNVDLNRHTTVGLLNTAFALIQNLKERARKLWMEKEDLLMEQMKLLDYRYNQLSAGSQCSAQTDSGTSKRSSENPFYWEQDEIDVVVDLDENWRNELFQSDENNGIFNMTRFLFS